MRRERPLLSPGTRPAGSRGFRAQALGWARRRGERNDGSGGVSEFLDAVTRREARGGIATLERRQVATKSSARLTVIRWGC